MIQCATCGLTAPETSSKCSRCGSELHSPTNGAPTISDETVAMPAPESTPRPRSVTSISRLSTTSIPDEGRFVPGTLVAGRYRVIGLLGRGGMGEVYRATDLTLGQSVALKFLPDEAAGNERLLERFHNEVRIARQVSHANVCRVYDIGEADGLPFMSMEYVDGEDLAGLLQRIGRLSNDKALEIARKLCAGLAAAHERGIIHRDLKPQNIMLNKRGEVVIMDFGLAAVADELHGAEARNGTPAYMAPEQLRGDSVTAKSDLYSLGLIVYELFTGKRPFDARTAADLLRAEETTRPPTISSVAPDVDPAVEKVIARCLQPDPAQRPPNALAIAAALPGGDPLAAALAAGETPSPELVAASGKAEGFQLRYAVPCLAFVLLFLLAVPFIEQTTSMISIAPIDFPPPVLEQKARDLAADLGYTARPTDWNSTFFEDQSMVSWLEKHRGSTAWRPLFAAASPIQFSYRQSPDYLLAAPDGDVTSDRPPMTLPGMLSVALDSAGRLRAFSAIAPRYGDNAAATPPDPALLFRKAGLDLAAFHEVPPFYAAPLAFDARRAWAGPYPGPLNAPITVQISTWRGQLTNFFIRWPWTKPPAVSAQPSSFGAVISGLFPIVFISSGFLAAVLLARRNIRAGRGDRQGAFRLVSAAFLIYFVTWAATAHVVPRFELMSFALNQLSVGLALCAFAWVLYIAVEPALRARWPQSLITWNRLLAGRFGDPRLGSHILIGVAVGLFLICLFIWRSWWEIAAGAAPEGLNNDYVLMGLRHVIALLGSVLFSAILAGIAIFFLLSGLRALVRREWIAAVVAAVLLTLQEGSIRHSTHLAIDLPLFIFVYAVFMFILLRMGLVPAIIAIFVINTFGNAPFGSEFSAWYNWIAVLQSILIALIALYGFWRSQSPPAERIVH